MVVERTISKPVSLALLSFQLMLILLKAVAIAPTLDGAIGADPGGGYDGDDDDWFDKIFVKKH